jgi:hypothetical protein
VKKIISENSKYPKTPIIRIGKKKLSRCFIHITISHQDVILIIGLNKKGKLGNSHTNHRHISSYLKEILSIFWINTAPDQLNSHLSFVARPIAKGGNKDMLGPAGERLVVCGVT